MMFGSLILLTVGGILIWQMMQRQRPPSEEESQARALRILEERYARGEIGRQEFEERRNTLRAPGPR